MEEQKNRARAGADRFRAFRLAVSLALCAAALACRLWYPAAADRLRPWIVGGGRTAAAFRELTESVQDGEPVGRAIEVFRAELTADGETS